MDRFQNILSACTKVREVMIGSNATQIDVAFKNLMEVYENEFSAEVLDSHVAYVNFTVIDVMIDNHIRNGDTTTVVIRASEAFNHFKQYQDNINFSEEEFASTINIIRGIYKKVRRFLLEAKYLKPDSKKENKPCICALCKKNIADKKGSHMVPHFFIQKFFSYDGGKGRDKEIVEEFCLSKGSYDRYFGHRVNDEILESLLNKKITDEEIEQISKRNPLTVDYIFCKDCETRFGVIEQYYAEILEGRVKKYSKSIPYLFWMSVIWRMSVGSMGVELTPKDEEKLRKVLNHSLSSYRNSIVTQNSKLGYCAYCLYRCDDIKDEQSGIIGLHRTSIPYMAIIGDYSISFFMNQDKAHRVAKKKGKAVNEVNNGTKEEVIMALTFIEFWSVKRFILDENWKNDRGNYNKLHLNKTRDILLLKNLEKELTNSGIRNFIIDPELDSHITENNPDSITIPHAVGKILRYMETHPNQVDKENMIMETGFNTQEIEYIMSYWVAKMEQTYL